MIYKGQTIEVKSGDTVLFRSGFVWYNPLTWLSLAIRFFTQCFYNHCAIIINDWQQPFINESNEKGIISRPLHKFLERNKTKIIILRPKFDFVEKEFCLKANDLLGTEYGFSVLFIYQLWFRLTGKWIGRTQEAALKYGMVCSEYVAFCYGLPNWWLYSAKELANSPVFEVVYRES